MFRWLANRFGLRSGDKSRFIFRFKDGQRKRSVDPIAVNVSLNRELGEDWIDQLISISSKPQGRGAFSQGFGVVGEQLQEEEKKKADTRTRILKATCKAFGVSEYSDNNGQSPPSGLTQIELMGLITGFVLFCNDLVEIARPFLNAQSRASPSPENSPPSNGSDSGSAGT